MTPALPENRPPVTQTGWITHPIYLEHDTGTAHPESPERLIAIEAHLQQTGLYQALTVIRPTLHPKMRQAVLEVHHPDYVQRLYDSLPQEGGRCHLDPDTPYGFQSLGAAEMAVSGVLEAIDQVMSGNIANAFCAVRPPGHHAETDRAMGFCLFNNIAIGARYLQRHHSLARIFIIDWDVHHGNGTQHCFYNDPTVFYFSTHQYPFYPGTGAKDERGEAEGEGTTLNCPLAAGAGDRELLLAFEKQLAPALANFRPDFILISAGFDAHRDDPLAGLRVTESGFSEMTRIVRAIGQTYCEGRIISCLEGGYNLSALARSVAAHLLVLSGA